MVKYTNYLLTILVFVTPEGLKYQIGQNQPFPCLIHVLFHRVKQILLERIGSISVLG